MRAWLCDVDAPSVPSTPSAHYPHRVCARTQMFGSSPSGAAPLPVQRGRQLTQVSVSTVSQLVAAVGDSAVDKILVAAGTYELISDMCLGSALCISRAITIEAEVPGTVVFDAKGDTCLYTCDHADGACRRPFLIQSGGAVTLIGLDITGGYSCRDDGYNVRHVLNFLRPCLCCVR